MQCNVTDIRVKHVHLVVGMFLCLVLSKALSMFIPKCAELIHTDEERSVVMTALDAYSELLKEIKGPVLEGEGHRDAILNCIKDVMTCKVLISDHSLFINKFVICHIEIEQKYFSLS
jgi:hypothetical protein